MHVVTPYGRAGASSRVRVFEWLDRVRGPAVVSPYLSHRNARPSYLLRHPRRVAAAEARLRRFARNRPERLLLHREASPLSRGALEGRLLRSADLAVYDLDDALNVDRGDGGLLRRVAPKAPKAHLAAREADRVVAGNPTLAEWASRLNPDVVVIPSCVAPEAYRQKVAFKVGDPPRIGWIGSPDNEVYLEKIAGALQEVHRRTGARLTLVGTTDESLGELERLIDRVAWSPTVQHGLLAELDVGVGPLPDTPYTRGKCGYRLLQYGAVGLPFVASPVGVNETILSRLGMPAAQTEDDWVDAIVELLTLSSTRRRDLGLRAAAATRDGYSYHAWLPHWLAAMELDARTVRQPREAVPTTR